MAYRIEKQTNDIVISGWEQGIAEDPYSGISDIRNINLISIPKEASVNFATSLNSNLAVSTGTVVSADAGNDNIVITGASGFVSGNAVVFAGAGLPAGITAGVVYWLKFISAGLYKVYSDIILSTLVNITGDGTGTFTVYNMGVPKYFTISGQGHWMIDSNGLVWTNITTGNWVFTGNIGGAGNNGNGLVYYQASDTTGYVFAFSDAQIDYIKIASNGHISGTWVYGWKPLTGATGQTGYLKNIIAGGSHETFIAPDNVVYYCDASYIGRFFEQTGQIFDPTNTATYIQDETRLLPFTDRAQCLAFLGTNLMIGGKLNVIYPWDTTSPTFSYPILLAESNIQKMITVNTNTYALVGNRGRIYYTNGTNAQLWKKVPDHISGTVEPYFTWGGLASTKNQIYFSASVTDNAGTANTNYGGLWAVDVDTKAIRLSNKLSYGTYAGYATAIITSVYFGYGTNPAGTGLFIGWDSGASTYGIDKTTSAPYVGGEATIDSDLIPIGTFLKPNTSSRVEFKLAVPIVSGESVKLQYRQKFSSAFADIDANITFNFAGIASGTWNGYAGVYQNVNFENSQWVQIRAILTSTASSPSFVRLTELRLK